MNETIPLREIPGSRAAILLSYPRLEPREVLRRVEEAEGLRVTAIELRGRQLIDGMPVLGKGHTGMVLAVKTRDGPAALKVRRLDADGRAFKREAEMLRMANTVSVGPRLLGASESLILMELVEGNYLSEWLSKPGLNAEAVRATIRELLEMARRLDLIGLHHGELSRAHRHILIAEGGPVLIDFESSSTQRKASNVTALTQYLFINDRVRRLLGGWIKLPEREPLLNALRRYKRTMREEDYKLLLNLCDIEQREVRTWTC